MGTKGKMLSNAVQQKQSLTSLDEHFPGRNFRLEEEEVQAKYARVANAILDRDGKAEWREWRAYRGAGGALLAVVILSVGFDWSASRGQRFVVRLQVVQHDEDCHLDPLAPDGKPGKPHGQDD